MGWWESWHPVAKNCCVAPLQQDPQSPPEVPDRLPLLLPSVPCQGSPHLLHLSGGNLVPATKGLHRQGNKVDAFPSAVLRGTIDFPLKGKLESVPRVDGSLIVVVYCCTFMLICLMSSTCEIIVVKSVSATQQTTTTFVKTIN